MPPSSSSLCVQASAERARLSALNDRIGRVRDRISRMSGSTRPITLFATPKYPAAEVARLATYVTLNTSDAHPSLTEPLDEQLAPFGAQALKAGVLGPEDEVLTRPEKRQDVVELLARVSLRGGDVGAALEAASAPPVSGLGSLPAYMPSVVGSLLFNSMENPYKVWNF
jgi:hypothetical protein